MPRVNALLAGSPFGTLDLGDLFLSSARSDGPRMGYVIPRAYNDATVSFVGASLSTNTGSNAVSAGGSYATTNIFTKLPRWYAVSTTTTANSTAGARGASLPAVGGFRQRFRWGAADAATVADARSFTGLASTDLGALASTDIVNLTQIMGFGADSTDTDLSVYHNDGSGAATKIALPGVAGSWPANGAGDEVYEGLIEVLPGGQTWNWWLKRLSTGVSASGQIVTNFPSSGGSYGCNFHRASGTTALAVRLGIFGLVIGDLRLFG